jgi:hypothetical protein
LITPIDFSANVNTLYRYTDALLPLENIAIAAKACDQYSVIGGRFDHQANIRTAPTFRSSIESILNAYGYGSGPGSLTWCGQVVHAEGVSWYRVEFNVSRNPYRHSGWVAQNMISYYSASETTTAPAAPSTSSNTNQNLNQNFNQNNITIVVPRGGDQ